MRGGDAESARQALDFVDAIRDAMTVAAFLELRRRHMRHSRSGRDPGAAHETLRSEARFPPIEGESYRLKEAQDRAERRARKRRGAKP
jgi:hypothetical protein